MTKADHNLVIEYRKEPDLEHSKRKCMELQDIYNSENRVKDLDCLCTVERRKAFLLRFFNWYTFRK